MLRSLIASSVTALTVVTVLSVAPVRAESYEGCLRLAAESRKANIEAGMSRKQADEIWQRDVAKCKARFRK